MINPKVSIIIPVYNGSDYVRQAIDSALSQTYENVEVIVVNDGSTDGGKTDAVCKEYGDKIKYYLKENGKCSSALNYGISKMTGEYFSWLSHDDLYDNEKIAKQIEAIEKYNIDTAKTIIGCAGCLINAEGNFIQYRKNSTDGFNKSDKELYNLFFKGTPNGNCFLISKEILQVVGAFDTSLVFINDWDYWVRVALKGIDYFYLPDYLTKTRIHRLQQTNFLYNLHNDEIIKSISNRIEENSYTKSSYAIIYYYCCYFGDGNLRKTVKKYLLKNNICVSFFKVFYYSVYGGIIRFLKNIKHKIRYRK